MVDKESECYTVKSRLTATLVILQSPRYYSHFFSAAWQKPPYIFLKKKKPSLIRPTYISSLVTVLTRFHCNDIKQLFISRYVVRHV